MLDVKIVFARLIMAGVLGALIGIDREKKNRAAGFRTHMIVSVASCLIMLIAIDGFKNFGEDWDAAKFAGGVVSGIGFLGGGTILQKKDSVSGLTTAATLWAGAAIGLATGIGYYEGAIIATVLCLITLSLKSLSDFINKRVTRSFKLVFSDVNFDFAKFKELTTREDIEVRELNIIDEDYDHLSMVECTLSFRKNYNVSAFIEILKNEMNLKKSEQKEY